LIFDFFIDIFVSAILVSTERKELAMQNWSWRRRIRRIAWTLSMFLLLDVPLAQAQQELLVSSWATDEVLRYDRATGAFLGAFVAAGSGGLSAPQGLAFGPDGDLYVSSFLTNEVLRYDGQTGAFLNVFVAAGSGGLANPHSVAFGPDGNLYVISLFPGEVLSYDGQTGAFLNAFIPPSRLGPQSLTFGPDGALYVRTFLPGDVSVPVLKLDGPTGKFLAFTTDLQLTDTGDLAFGPDGDLYVSEFKTNSVRRYDGQTGAFLNVFVAAGSGGLTGGTILVPGGLLFGPDGDLYATSPGTNEVLRYDGATGEFLNAFVTAGSGGLATPSYLLFRVSTGLGAAEEVQVQIRPGSLPNRINPKSNGLIRVAILSTETFDATTVDPQSLRFGPKGAQEAHNKGHIRDVNHDGRPDLILHFRARATGIQCGHTAASLTGETFVGASIQGFDAIQTVGCKK
jgi:DNA-binding beta-propeller fold protein YncE